MKFTGEATAAVITAESARSRDMTIPGRRVFTSRAQRLFRQWGQTQLFGPDPARRDVRFRYHELCDRVSPWCAAVHNKPDPGLFARRA
jgi:hypothetical protein